MDGNDPAKPVERTDAEHELDGWNPWNLPRAAPVPTPTLDEWPERDLGSQHGVPRVEGSPAT